MINFKQSKKVSPSELRRLALEQTILENTRDESITNGTNRNTEIEVEERRKEYVSMREQSAIGQTNRVKFCTNLRNSLLSECLYKLYKESSTYPLDSNDKTIARNLVNKFVLENGAQTLISKFSTKNLLLSEFSRISSKYFDKILEDCDAKNEEHECKEFIVDPLIKDEFLKELEMVDTDDATKLIRDRISDSISEFVDSNMMEKLEYEDVIKSAQDRISTVKDESFIEQYSNAAKRKINEMKLLRKKNVFHCLVESLCAASLKDESLKQRYIKEAQFDMDKIVEHGTLIYTMLEMANTTNMVNIDEEYLNKYIKTL